MQKHSFLPEFSDDDVVEFSEDIIIKIGKIRNAFIEIFNEPHPEENLMIWLAKKKVQIPQKILIKNEDEQKIEYQNKFLDEGVSCQALQLGAKSWRKGKLKLRLSLEFEPDEPEIKEPASPLDDIRQTINQ